MKFFKEWWLAGCFIAMTVVSMAIIIIPTSITSRNSLSTLARDIMVNITSYTIDKSKSYLLPAEKAAELTKFLADSKIVSSETPLSMINYFYQQMNLYPQFTSIYYGNIKGEFFMASRSNARSPDGFYTKIIRIENNIRTCDLTWSDRDHLAIESKEAPEDRYDPRQRPWFIDAVMQNDIVWTAPYLFFTGNKPGITTASPVYDERGILKGVVGVDISIEELSIFLSKLTIGKGGKAFIVDSSGDVVAFPDLKELKQIGQDGQKIRLSKITELEDKVSQRAFSSLNLPPDKLPRQAVFTSFIYDNKRYSAMFTPFSNSKWPWIIGIYIPENDYLGGIKNTQTINIIIAICAVILAGITGWGVARKLEMSRENAIRANESKSSFLAMMSHEIRTPMNVILGATDLLMNSGPREQQKSYIKLLRDAGTGLLDLLNDILDMSKVEAGLLELENIGFNPRKLLRQSMDVFTFAAEKKNIALELEIEPEFPEGILGDPVRMKQVLINLIGNAVKFTSSGGVYVRADAARSAKSNKIKLIFKVHDTGPGIPASQQKTIFKSFTQADRSITREHSGTGLGLSISKSISKLMEGDIEVNSSPGNGSTFIFTATVSECRNLQKAETEPVSEDAAPCTPRRVLLVEDNRSNQMLFSHYLQDSPHEISIASNGEDGVKMFGQLKPDIVFMDIEMPIMDGYEATRELRKWEKDNNSPETPVVALSAHAIKGTEEAVREAGCTSYMTKPVTKTQLLEKIKKHT
ncbi:ATP-binding protein [Maridesulfovibrio sp.]|uniref:hybrid sensor histidine kinase/response regulator n=1 Tax=Maridesulfovibrio sp. TaxID=2795000 RepID=UPI002A18C097|nr:ATP-binding protein [Maridesulfovibrio sp.]